MSRDYILELSGPITDGSSQVQLTEEEAKVIKDLVSIWLYRSWQEEGKEKLEKAFRNSESKFKGILK